MNVNDASFKKKKSAIIKLETCRFANGGNAVLETNNTRESDSGLSYSNGYTSEEFYVIRIKTLYSIFQGFSFDGTVPTVNMSLKE
jgi:hypothetical protein